MSRGQDKKGNFVSINQTSLAAVHSYYATCSTDSFVISIDKLFPVIGCKLLMPQTT